MVNFYYITVATKRHDILDNIIKLIKKNEEQIHILGLHENRNIGWQSTGNFGVKLKEVYNFVFQSEIQNNDIILFTDAYDVIYTGNQREIVKKYLEMNSPIVFGCETTCNPDPEKHVYYSKKDVDFPYLNSGMFIGMAGAIRECMKNYKYDDNHDDQRFWTQQFFDKPELIKLDYENNLFLNTYQVDIEDIKIKKGICFYKQKNPMFVHVNGPDKSDLSKFL